MDKISQNNQRFWDSLSLEQKSPYVKGANFQDIKNAKEGNIKIYLTPLKTVPKAWLHSKKNAKVLCLASGGGQQGPILAAFGYDVTVYDLSLEQLNMDTKIANKYGLKLRTVQGDMRNLSAFPNETFDMIVHPVSNVFVDNIESTWRECYRVLKKNGILISGFINPLLYIFDDFKMEEKILYVVHKLPYSPFNPDAKEELKHMEQNDYAYEFGHTLSEQINGQLKQGFLLQGFYEDKNPPTIQKTIEKYSDIYIATKAIKL